MFASFKAWNGRKERKKTKGEIFIFQRRSILRAVLSPKDGLAVRSRLAHLLAQFPAGALLGPRQVGKTTLAWQFMEGNPKAAYLDLELPSDLAKLTDAEDYFSRHQGHLLVLDEIQRKPDLFPILRSVMDAQKRKGRQAGQFLLLGSTSLDLLKQSSESLAGRLATLEIASLSGRGDPGGLSPGPPLLDSRRISGQLPGSG